MKAHRVNEKVSLFNFVVCQDLFDNYERYQIFFRPLVRKYPGLRFLVFNWPGQAYTEFHKSTLFNNRYYSNVLKGLLDYLDVDGTSQFITTGVPFYLMGFGNGANTALHYSLNHGHPSLRGLVSMNGFTYIGKHMAGAMHDCINVFSSCPETRPDMPLYFFARFIFSGTYLRTTSTPLALNLYSAIHNPITLAGRIQICKGVLSNLDVRPDLEELTCPLIVVQGTEDALVHPIHVKPLAHMRGGEVQSIHHCLRGRKRSCVVWVEGGHELWQEKSKQIRSLVEQLATGYYEVHDVPMQHLDTVLGPQKKDREALPSTSIVPSQAPPGGGGGSNGDAAAIVPAGENIMSGTFEDKFIDNVLGKLTDVQRKSRREANKRRMQVVHRG